MKFSDYVKVLLIDSIGNLASDPTRYARNPDRDFSRKDFLLMFLTMEADCIREELYRYFGPSSSAPSKPAFYKQCQKLRQYALRSLLLEFNKKCGTKLWNGRFSLVACDGSAADIFRNPYDTDTFFEPNGKSNRGFNQIHINAHAEDHHGRKRV